MRVTDRDILRLAVPALGSLAIEPLYVLVDTAVVGRLGTAPLGGLALAATVLNVAFWAFNFLAYATTARVAFLVGRGDERAAACVAVQALWLACALGTAVAGTLWLAAPWAARVLGGEGAVLDAAVTYLRIAGLAVPFILVALVGNGYLRGLSDTRTPLVVVLAGNVVNLVVELWFVYGPGLGIAGSAASTLLAQGISAAWFIALIGTRVRAAAAPLRPDTRELRVLASSGHQLVVRTGALLATLTAATAVAARTGQTTLAAHQIALQVWTLLALALDALAIAAQALVGTALGRADVPAARDIGRRVIALSAWVGVVLAVGVSASAPVLPALFTLDGAVRRGATIALVAVGVTQLPGAAVFALDGILMGASDFRFLKWGTLAGLATFAPFSAAVLVNPSLGIAGIWTGLGAWLVARLAVNGTRFAGTRWLAAVEA